MSLPPNSPQLFDALKTGKYLGQYPIYGLYREKGRVFRDGDVVHVLGYYEAKDVFSRNHDFSSNTIHIPRALQPVLTALVGGNIGVQDDPEHHRVREQIVPPLRPRLVRQNAPHVGTYVENVIHAASSRDRVDVSSEIAFPVSAIMMNELLGITDEQAPAIARSLTNFDRVFSSGVEGVNKRELIRAIGGALNFDWAASRLLMSSKSEGELLAAIRGADISQQAKVASILVMMLGGRETTASALTNVLAALKNDPDQRAIVAEIVWSGDDKKLKTAVESLLRFDGPSQQRFRVATQDTFIGDFPVKKGDRISVWMGAANRDPRAMHDGDELNVETQVKTGTPERPAADEGFNEPHLSFGGWGPHACPGWAYATELAVAVVKKIDWFDLDFGGPVTESESSLHFSRAKGVTTAVRRPEVVREADTTMAKDLGRPQGAELTRDLRRAI